MITERMQQAVLHRAFIAKQLIEDFDVSGWSEPWRTIALLADRPNPAIIGLDGLGQAIRVVAEDAEHADYLRYQIEQAGQPLHVPNLLEISANLPSVDWLWENWIPKGLLSMIGAYPGTGKSWFVLDLARIIIEGGRWPDGVALPGPAPVVYVDAEGIPQVLNQRAVELGIDRSRLYLMFADAGEVFDLAKQEWRDRLIDVVMTIRPALVIIDSFSSVTSNGQNSVEDTNDLFAFLVGLARHANCGMLLVHHLRKPPGGQLSYLPMSIHDFRGSGHIIAMPRTVLGLSVVQRGKSFSLNGPRRVDVVKTNLGPYPDGIGVEMQIGADGRTAFTYGPPDDHERTETKGDSVESFLLAFLSDGPKSPAEVIEAGEQEGYGRRLIYRTRKEMGTQIINTAGYRNPKNKWALAGQAEEADDDDDQSFDESEE